MDGAACETLIADLQLHRAGLGGDPLMLAERGRLLRRDLRRLGVADLVEQLLADEVQPHVPAVLDLDGDEDTRRASYEVRCADAQSRLPLLWHWLSARYATSGPGWWRDAAADLDPGSDAALTAAQEPPQNLGGTADRWANAAGLSDGRAEFNWRWLLLGRGLAAALPGFHDTFRALVLLLRGHGLLPAEHRVQVLMRANSPSMVLAVRVPGHSVLSVPTSVSPVTVQYLQHELAHLSEHALRSPDRELRERWRFDPVRSEGWALLLEHVVQQPSWLELVGFTPTAAEDVSAFLREEERFTRGLMAADLMLAGLLPDARSLAHAVGRAADVAAATGLGWAPSLLMHRAVNLLQWRSYLAGWTWRDAALAELVQEFGPAWFLTTEAWALLRDMLRETGSASDSLRFLGANGRVSW